MLKYYTVPWSLHCQKGEQLLRKAEVNFEKVDLANWNVFDAAPRDLGFHRLPVLVGKGILCEGLEQIAGYVSNLDTHP